MSVEQNGSQEQIIDLAPARAPLLARRMRFARALFPGSRSKLRVDTAHYLNAYQEKLDEGIFPDWPDIIRLQEDGERLRAVIPDSEKKQFGRQVLHNLLGSSLVTTGTFYSFQSGTIDANVPMKTAIAFLGTSIIGLGLEKLRRSIGSDVRIQNNVYDGIIDAQRATNGTDMLTVEDLLDAENEVVQKASNKRRRQVLGELAGAAALSIGLMQLGDIASISDQSPPAVPESMVAEFQQYSQGE